MIPKPEYTKPGDILQLSPTDCYNRAFSACLLTVTEVKPWGVQGYVQALGQGGEMGERAYYRAQWEELEPTGGVAAWAMGEAALETESVPSVSQETLIVPLLGTTVPDSGTNGKEPA